MLELDYHKLQQQACPFDFPFPFDFQRELLRMQELLEFIAQGMPKPQLVRPVGINRHERRRLAALARRSNRKN